MMVLVVLQTVVSIPPVILAGLCLSCVKAKPWHYKALAAFIALFGLFKVYTEQYLGLPLCIAVCVGAVMPMGHWPTRYLRPISIRSDEGVLPQ
jgi:hypothetical protein